MKVFVVYYNYHYDDYKRADSYADLCGVFYNENDAYSLAVKNYKKMLDNYANYNYTEIVNCEKHIIDRDWEQKGLLLCMECGNSLNKDCTLDFTDEDNKFSKENLDFLLNDLTKTSKEIYKFIEDNLYEILPKPEFTMLPTHERYHVKDIEIK